MTARKPAPSRALRHLSVEAESTRVGAYRGSITGVKVDKMSVSFEAALGDEIRRAARAAGVGLSSWLALAAAARLRADALREFLESWETAAGGLTPDELARAEAELGLRADEPAA